MINLERNSNKITIFRYIVQKIYSGNDMHFIFFKFIFRIIYQSNIKCIIQWNEL